MRVTHTTVAGHEFALARSRLVRGLAWLRRAPGRVRTGLEFAGVVESSGRRFGPGDRVMGYVDMIAGWKAHADYVAIPEAQLAEVPDAVSLAEAATLPMGGQTALVALRDVAAVEAGQSVLIFGASGGVGVLAVQIAVLLGARATAVASSSHHARLKELGAAEVVDSRRGAPASMSGRYDAIFDFSDTLCLAQIRHLLAPRGVFVPADPIANLGDVLFRRSTKWLMVDRGDGALLEPLAEWAEQGRLRAVIDGLYDLEQWPAAVERSHARGKAGRVVLRLSDASPERRRDVALPVVGP